MRQGNAFPHGLPSATKLELPFIDLIECGAFAHRDWTHSHDTALSNIMWKNKKRRPRGGSVANIYQ
jgi:hypothetical protein